MSGKGSSPRPIPNPEKFQANWDSVFGKGEQIDKKPKTITKKCTRCGQYFDTDQASNEHAGPCPKPFYF